MKTDIAMFLAAVSLACAVTPAQIETWLTGLPVTAVEEYKTARLGNSGRDSQMALRSWMSKWLRAMHDEGNRVLVQLDFVEVICLDCGWVWRRVIRPDRTEVENGHVKMPEQTPGDLSTRASTLKEAKQLLLTLRTQTHDSTLMKRINKRQEIVDKLITAYGP